MVYIREAHGGEGDPAAARDLIRAHARELHLPFRCVLDGAGAEAEVAYRAWPRRLVVLAPDGRLAYDAGGLSSWDLDAVASWLEGHASPPAVAHGEAHEADGLGVGE